VFVRSALGERPVQAKEYGKLLVEVMRDQTAMPRRVPGGVPPRNGTAR
jgi:hypothetical protein